MTSAEFLFHVLSQPGVLFRRREIWFRRVVSLRERDYTTAEFFTQISSFEHRIDVNDRKRANNDNLFRYLNSSIRIAVRAGVKNVFKLQPA